MIETVSQAKNYLKNNWEHGTHCPVCTQYVKKYKRALTSSMAYALILINKNYEKNPSSEWLHVENYFKTLDIPPAIRGDFSKLKYWGLLEYKAEKREDSSYRNGFYRITQLGRDFVRGLVNVASHIYLYNNKFYGFCEDEISIKEALKNRFNYEELVKA